MFNLLHSSREKGSNFKCGEVYCEIPNSYNVNCSACGAKFAINEFPQHFQDLHLNSQNTSSKDDIKQVILHKITSVNKIDITCDSNKSFEDSTDEEDQQEMPIEFMEVRLPKLKSSKANSFLPELIMDFGLNMIEAKKDLESINTKKKTTDFSASGKENIEIQKPQNSVLSQEDVIVDKDNTSKTVPKEVAESDDLKTKTSSIRTTKVGEGNDQSDEKCQLFIKEENKIISSNCEIPKVGTKSETKSAKGKNQEQFTCKYCQRCYKVKRSLKNHVRVIHEKIPVTATDKTDHRHKELTNKAASICNICGKSFTTVGSMNTHKKRHNGVKSHKCPECDNSFHTDHEMKKHLLYRHSGLFAEICEICGRGFRISGNLKGHMRRHTGERPAKCDVCGKSFYSQYDLNVHNVTHTTERPFSCDVCSSTFRTKKALRVHKKLHVPDRPHQCELCDKGFLQLTGLDSHMRQVHMKSVA